MVSYDLELTLLVFFLILLIILKLIFALGRKSDEKPKQEKQKEVAVSKSVSEKDSYGVAKVKEQPTTYIINSSTKQVDSNSGGINSDAYLGNYMQDVLVLNEPNPCKMAFENGDKVAPIDSEKQLQNIKKDAYSLDNKINDILDQPVDNFNNEMFEQLVELDAKKAPNSTFMKEYRGLSREMKIYLISKILDKRVNH